MTGTIGADRIDPPGGGEYGAFYAGYIGELHGDDPLAAMANQLGTTGGMLESLSEAQGAHRYAPGKWSVRELVGHLGDTERIMSYRALRIARGDTTPLPGFDENAFVAGANFEQRTLASLVREWQAVRRATIALFAGLDAAALARVGAVNDHPMSARALAHIIAGHERHHLRVLRERYGIGAT